MSGRLTRALGVAAAVVLTVVACGESPAGAEQSPCPATKPCERNPLPTGDDRWYVQHATVDGRDVLCLIYMQRDNVHSMSLSCDWSPR
jgi:hypothetical protein